MKSKQKMTSLKYIAFSAILAALTFVMTMYAKLPIPVTNNGYVHLGDSVVMLAGALLPWPYALGAACIGAGLSDLVLAPAWIPATVIIKGLTVLCFTSKKEKMICPRNLIAIVPSALLCAGGYYLYEAVVYGNWVAPAVNIPLSLLQTVMGAVIYVAVAYGLDRLHFKSRVLGG